jgi:hypothetical protein
MATSQPAEIISPNNILANAMLRSVDMIRPRLQATRPERVALCVGTQINGAPHLGTSLVQTAAFSKAGTGPSAANWSTRRSPSSPDHRHRRGSSPPWC